MLTGNKLYKLNDSSQVVKITTDDIPEGEFNKYCLNYADGKLLGDIVLRPSSSPIKCHRLLDGSMIYEHQYKEFYDFCIQNKQLAEEDPNYDHFNKTIEEYDLFLAEHTDKDESGKIISAYCPYFVTGTQTRSIYKVTKNGLIGYTDVEGVKNVEVPSGYVYDTEYLQTVVDYCDDWYYTGDVIESVLNYVKLPTYTLHEDDNFICYYYFVVVESRVENDTTSIRSVAVGQVESLTGDEQAYVRNSGTLQNLILDFGIPCGQSAAVYIGDVESGEEAAVENVGTDNEAILNFVLPKGEQGIAGGVVVLKQIVDELPTDITISSPDKYYLTTDNKIYTYKNSNWVEHSKADMGLIYLVDSKIYYFDGEGLISTNAETTIDNSTIQKDANGALQSVGVKTVQGSIMYDWIGTLKEWEQGRANGSILDTYVCFVIDD